MTTPSKIPLNQERLVCGRLVDHRRNRRSHAFLSQVVRLGVSIRPLETYSGGNYAYIRMNLGWTITLGVLGNIDNLAKVQCDFLQSQVTTLILMCNYLEKDVLICRLLSLN